MLIACLTAWVVASLSSMAQGADEGPQIVALRGMDPVALVEGREVVGDPMKSLRRGKYEYRFASEDAQRAFNASPDRFSIQLGGACARMGLLTGLGDPDRFLVHDRRIYIFASDACRAAFAKNPDLFLDQPSAPLEGSDDDAASARELLTKAVASIGGAQRLKALRSLRQTAKETYGAGERAVTCERLVTILFPLGYRVEERWGAQTYFDSTDGSTGVRGGRESFMMDAVEVTEMERRLALHPIAILKAFVSADSRLVAFARGGEMQGDRAFAKVEVSLRGAVSTLLIDPDSGLIVASRVVERKRVQQTERITRYHDFRDIGGLVLPHSMQSEIDGRSTDPNVAVSGYFINLDEVDPGYFLGN